MHCSNYTSTITKTQCCGAIESQQHSIVTKIVITHCTHKSSVRDKKASREQVKQEDKDLAKSCDVVDCIQLELGFPLSTFPTIVSRV